MKTATNPIENEIRAPTNVLLNKSLPYLSVPSKNFLEVIFAFAKAYIDKVMYHSTKRVKRKPL